MRRAQVFKPGGLPILLCTGHAVQDNAVRYAFARDGDPAGAVAGDGGAKDVGLKFHAEPVLRRARGKPAANVFQL